MVRLNNVEEFNNHFKSDNKKSLSDAKLLFAKSLAKHKFDLLTTIYAISIFLALFLLIFTDFDLKLQNYFYDFYHKEWLIDRDEKVKKLLFYNLPKIILAILIFIIFVLTIYFYYQKQFYKYLQSLLLLLGIASNLLFVANIKKFTNIRCPNQIVDFNGNFIYNKVFDSNFSRYNKKGQCFPAGHAVTAFCLMITYYIFNQKFIKIMLLMISVISGWIIGIYQIAKGAHFFGDTLISMLLCGLVANLVVKYFVSLYLKNIKIYDIFNLK